MSSIREARRRREEGDEGRTFGREVLEDDVVGAAEHEVALDGRERLAGVSAGLLLLGGRVGRARGDDGLLVVCDTRRGASARRS